MIFPNFENIYFDCSEAILTEFHLFLSRNIKN